MKGYIGTLEALKSKLDKKHTEESEKINVVKTTSEEILAKEDSKMAEESKKLSTNNSQSQAVIKNKTTDSLLYFIDINTLERLDIQFIPTLNIDRNSNLNSIQVIGRNIPKYHYTGGETLLSLVLDFHSLEEDRKDVIDKCRWLEHLTVSNSILTKNKRVKLVFGDLFRDELWSVKKVSYKLDNFSKIHGFLPQQAYVNIELCLDLDDDISSESVRSDGGKTYFR